MTELRTDRLILRRARPEDLEAMHAVLTDERAMQYWSEGPHADIAPDQGMAGLDDRRASRKRATISSSPSTAR